jgi:hypothetical protein
VVHYATTPAYCGMNKVMVLYETCASAPSPARLAKMLATIQHVIDIFIQKKGLRQLSPHCRDLTLQKKVMVNEILINIK